MSRRSPKGKYAQLHDSEWQKTLSPLAKKHGCVVLALYLYLLSNPARNLIGIYLLNFDYVCIDLNLDRSTLDQSMKILKEEGLILIDDETGEVFVVDMLRTQAAGARPGSSDNRSKAVDVWLLNAESDELVEEFNSIYNWIEYG